MRSADTQVGSAFLCHERIEMVSDKLRGLLDHLKDREEIAGFETPMARMRANLHELSEEDIAVLVEASIPAAKAVGITPVGYAMSLMTIGLELGRELERRI